MKTLYIDIECYSDTDLSSCGVYKYAEDLDFEILLFGYAVEDSDIHVVDLTNGEKIPKEVINALVDNNITKVAHNAMFERVCLSAYLHKYYTHMLGNVSYISPTNWRCSMIHAAYLGLPFSLEQVGMVLGLEEQKLKEGKDLIKYFCVPCKPTKANGMRVRNMPSHDKAKWELFKKYNKRDVEVEISICKRLKNYDVPDFVWKEYETDQEINDRGVLLDIDLVKNAIDIANRSRTNLMDRLQNLTNLENPNSVIQMREWLKENGVETDSLDKKSVESLLESDISNNAKEVLTIRQSLAKSSIKKYERMRDVVCTDNRARGLFQFYGANHSGRYSSRLIQIQNLARNNINDLELAHDLVKVGDYEILSLVYENTADILSQLIRTALIPKKGYKFIVADYSAIEARVLSWLAGEPWRIKAFENGEDIYCSTATRMFKVKVVKHGENGELRQKGKVAELACIAEGELVLTNHGLKPIEIIDLNDKLWDGEEWVKHDGVIYKGKGEIIDYDGLRATKDHIVWCENSKTPIRFGDAAKSGTHLIQTGDGRRAIRKSKNYKPREKMEREDESLLCFSRMPSMWKYSLGFKKFNNKWNISRLSSLLQYEKNTSMVRKKISSSKKEMRKSQRSTIQKLWSKRDKIRFSISYKGRRNALRKIWTTREKFRIRQNRQQWKLFNRQFKICDKENECREQENNDIESIRATILAICRKCCNKKIIKRIFKGRNYKTSKTSGNRKEKKMENNRCKVRLYDIRNAGRHHCFTVSNHLVHNCGYGGSVGALKAFGAEDMGLNETEMQAIVNSWREANPNIVSLWYEVDRAVKNAIRNNETTIVRDRLKIGYKSGMLYITLPSGRSLHYAKPEIIINRFGSESVSYYGLGQGRKWTKLESYGAKFVENIVQGIARDLLTNALENLKDFRVVAHVHDEVIVESEADIKVDEISKFMCKAPKWADGLPLDADGYECEFYKKD